MIPVWPYIFSLAVIGGYSLLFDKTRKIAATLFVVWCVCTAAVYGTGDATVWRAFAITNIIGACVLLKFPLCMFDQVPPPSRTEATIGGSLFVQAIIDCSFGFAANPSQGESYLLLQDQIAYGQLLVLGLWHGGFAIHIGMRSYRATTRKKAGSGLAGR